MNGHKAIYGPSKMDPSKDTIIGEIYSFAHMPPRKRWTGYVYRTGQQKFFSTSRAATDWVKVAKR